ncbi:MAG: hypothetical protein ABIY70_03145 [Capsulimonas sp.]|uniref:hypothetical protein n=1 Tax=Capsulimonas sp. TaxID=2494211 RepID=UPI00326596B2
MFEKIGARIPSNSWVTKAGDDKVAIRAPLLSRIDPVLWYLSAIVFLFLSLFYFGLSTKGSWNMATTLSFGGMAVFWCVCVWILARMMAPREMTVDLARRTYVTRSIWPGAIAVGTGSMDEFSGVFIYEETGRVYLRRKQGNPDRTGICLGSPSYGSTLGRSREFATAEYAEEAARLLGVPLIWDPRTLAAGTTRVQIKIQPKRIRK